MRARPPIRSPRDLRHAVFARLYDRLTVGYEELVAPHKRALFASLAGHVVEIGPGTGASLALLPPGVRWTGIEPNPFMHAALRAKARAAGLEPDVRTLVARNLPFGDGSVDAVLSSLVLCSVPDVAATLAEIRRVLVPGGRFVFWEHGLAPRGRACRLFQHAFTPVQRLLADGCHCDRDLGRDLRAAGFSRLELLEFEVPRRAAPFWLRPHLAGEAVA